MTDAELDKITEEVMQSVLAAELSWRDTVQVGDYVNSSDDKTFLSGGQYLTKGKLYKVKQLDFREDTKSYCVVVDADIPDEIAWLSMTGLIIRDGIVIWNWHDQTTSGESFAAYMDRAKEQLNQLKNK
jgi:uncharacterized protein (DUF1330 family)